MTKVVCSAPGKVLITGGYLVLERPNRGLVITVNARFQTIIEPLAESSAEQQHEFDVRVISEQFGSTIDYKIQLSDGQFSISPRYIMSKQSQYNSKMQFLIKFVFFVSLSTAIKTPMLSSRLCILFRLSIDPMSLILCLFSTS